MHLARRNRRGDSTLQFHNIPHIPANLIIITTENSKSRSANDAQANYTGYTLTTSPSQTPAVARCLGLLCSKRSHTGYSPYNSNPATPQPLPVSWRLCTKTSHTGCGRVMQTIYLRNVYSPCSPNPPPPLPVSGQLCQKTSHSVCGRVRLIYLYVMGIRP